MSNLTESFNLSNIDSYLAATGYSLGIARERYGGEFRALVGLSANVNYFVDDLQCDDQLQSFLNDNVLFPAGKGETLAKALQNLNIKLGLLYSYEPGDHGGLHAHENFTLPCDWEDIVDELKSIDRGDCFYDDAKSNGSIQLKPCLSALLNFTYDGDFAKLWRL